MNNIEILIEKFKKIKEKEIQDYIIFKDNNLYHFCTEALTLMKDDIQKYSNFMHSNSFYANILFQLVSLIMKLGKLDKKKKYNIGFKYYQTQPKEASVKFDFGIYELDDKDFLNLYKNKSITKFHFNTEIITRNEVMLNVKYKDIRSAVLYKLYSYLYEDYNYNVYEL